MTADIDLESTNFPELVLAGARRHPDREALVDGGTRWTYAELRDQVLASAAAAGAAGLGPGNRAAVWAPNSALWVVAALGVQARGAAVVPLTTRFRGAEGAFVLRASGAKLLFTVRDFLDVDYPDVLAEADPSCSGIPTVLLSGTPTGAERSWESYLDAGDPTSLGDRDELPDVNADTVSDVMFTSGTTGLPKGVLTTHGQNLLAWRDYSRCLDLRADDRSLVVLPLSHNFGFKAGFVCSMLAGACAVTLDVFDEQRVMQLVEAERITVLSGTPTLLQGVLDSPLRTAYDLSSLRKGTVAGATVAVDLVRRLAAERVLPRVMSGYGLSESAGGVALSDPDDSAERVATTCGRVRPHVTVRIVDALGGEVAVGEPGEILVQSPTVMLGYLGRATETEAALAGGWLHTGDLGAVDAEGYLTITGRTKDMFIVGGFNAYPAEIELALQEHPSVGEAAVVGVPDPRLGEVGAAFVVPAAGGPFDPDELLAWARGRLANYKVPRHLHAVESLPRNVLLKVDKVALRDQARALCARG